ncbi:MAG: aldo/keto reductase [Deltaproteobacteria bacterium]|nr:aldo/keto reductase [Deltaproteobacteria bacterium]
MQYVHLGDTGLEVSRLCLGTMTYGSPAWRPWVLDEEASLPLLRRSVEAGVNFFDTADVYSRGVSEELVGRALRDLCRRDEVVIATKVYFPLRDEGANRLGLSRKRILDCIDASLRRLGTDYVDLYQVHRFDPHTPIEETLQALDDVVRAGKVRYLGASSSEAWRFARALYKAELHGWTRFVSMQNHYNLVFRNDEREMLPLCQAEGVGVIPYSPLARGFLAGTRRRDDWETTLRARTDAFARPRTYRDCDWEVLDRVVELAGKRAVSPAQIALAWLLDQPAVAAPIIGVSHLAQLEEALTALEVELAESERARLEEPYRLRQGRGYV